MKRYIALISEHASPLAALGGVDAGGQNVYVGELAKHLGMLGYEVDVFTRYDDARLPAVVEWTSHVRVIHIKAGPVTYVRKEDLLQYMGEFTDNVLAFIRQEGIDYKLFHANFWMSALVAADIKQLTGIPFVVTFHALGAVRVLHQQQADQFPADRMAIERRVVQEADRIVAECPQDQADLIEYYDADPNKITIIPPGVNSQQFYPIDRLLARMILNLDPEERLILQLGRMVPRKGIETVVRALAVLNKDLGMPARLLIVGGESNEPDPDKTPEIGRLADIARRLGIKRKVTFVGRKGREDLKYYYSAADVFVSTPWYEPFGMTLLEAMACGTPAIGSDVGGVKYSIVEGQTGYLVPAKDHEALAQKLHEFFSNQKLVDYFRQNALRRVSSEFTWPKIAHSMSKLYETVSAAYETPRSFHANKLSILDQSFGAAITTLRKSSQLLQLPMLEAASTITAALSNGAQILVCGNAAQANYLAAELSREAYALSSVVALAAAETINLDGEILTQQVEDLGKPGDVLIGISASGSALHLVDAFSTARAHGMTIIALLGKNSGAAEYADIPILVPSYDTRRVRETHLHILHIVCELVEKNMAALEPVEGRFIGNPVSRRNGSHSRNLTHKEK